MTKIQLLSILISLLFLIVTFELVRKRKLKEEYSIIWFFAGCVILMFSCFNNLLELLAEFLGIFYAPAVLIPIAIFCGVLICWHFSIVISKLSKDNTTLVQEVALLKEKVDRLESK
jgi:hypothetical protein